jgi:hypothetical protein
MTIETPLDYILSFEFTKETLELGKRVLADWDQKPDSFYKSKLSMKIDRAEREHYRNAINYWEKKLNATTV